MISFALPSLTKLEKKSISITRLKLTIALKYGIILVLEKKSISITRLKLEIEDFGRDMLKALKRKVSRLRD